MKNTKFVSAGAGSGKTYRLTQDIAKMIANSKCKAEEIILTTFTESAAKELREKVRSTLYSKGLYEAAINIDNAAIGTIHSIAYQFVSRYWYLLGISANVSIMDTEGSKFCISQSLASLPAKEDLDLFEEILTSFNVTKSVNNVAKPDPDFWKWELNKIIDKTVELRIDEKQLEEAKEESKKLLNEVMRWSNFNISNDIISEVVNRLNPIFDTIASKARKDKKAKRKELGDSISGLEKYDGNIGGFPFAKLISVAKSYSTYNSNLGKYIQTDFADSVLYFTELVDKLPHSAQVRNLVESYIDTIFRLAIKWKKEYEEFKRKRCLLDFGDLLQKFHELLQKEEVVADIKSRYKVAFVDEFQDCSPLQVESFERLSELMEQSVWVGDIKQAIYGFRGTNTELIKSIIDKAKEKNDGNKREELKHCWRSNETIVNLVNNIFCEKVFKGQLDDELIRLYIPTRTENDPPKPQERELQHMHFVCSTKKDIPEALAEKIEGLITNGIYKPNEIAVLYRDKYGVQGAAKALKDRGIAYNARFDNDTNEDENRVDDVSSFISAVVSFAARRDNELSKAIIANRVEAGYSTSKLITNRLQYLENKDKEWLSDLDVIARIVKLRKAIGNQGVKAAIETIIVELNLAGLIGRIDPTAPAYNYCAALESKAAAYEGICANFGLSSTLVGFVEYLNEHPIECPGDDNGVSIMTYHKSKGLEWPCVILCSLHRAAVDPEKAFFGVLTYNTETDSILRLVPAAIKGFTSSIMDRFEENTFFKNIRRATLNEAKRLMYVGMTRPKEQLILATYGQRSGDDWLTSIGCDSIDSHSAASVINWGGANWEHSSESYVAPEAEESSAEIAEFTVLKQPAERPVFDVKFISPSKVKAANQHYAVEQCATFAERISAVAADGRDNTIGDFIHHAMCLWSGDKGVISTLANAYGVSVDIEAVATSVANFWSWMENTYGKATAVERELPFSFTNEGGQVVNGEIDLVYRTAEGDVLVDYKTYQGSPAHLTDESSDFHTDKKYGAQIALYEQALKRSGSVIRDRLVCYLSLGVIIKMK